MIKNRSVEIFNNLEGKWALNREITDSKKNAVYLAQGMAIFKKNLKPEILYYVENGHVQIKESSNPLKFSRKYIYKLNQDSIDIYLDDGPTKGKLFQRIEINNLNENFIGSEHLCRLDKHNGTYHFIDEFNFRIKYTVVGPNTNLFIKTIFSKII